jgi:uncharacterized protein (DUF934 family)
MPKIIKDGAIVEDAFSLVQEHEDGSLRLPNGPVVVQLGVWQRHRAALLAHPFPKGVQLAADELSEAVSGEVDYLDLIAIEFPQFVDGRGYSTARLLRDRHGFKGELRAVGDIFKDTLFFQQRCGFNAFAVKPEKCLEDALSGLTTFTVRYQGAIDAPPLYLVR